MENITNKNTPRDVFLYILSVVMLGVFASFLATLFFQIINIKIPDVVTGSSYGGGYEKNLIRTALAAIVIVFPVYFWIIRFLRKDLTLNPEKGEMKIRKWLLYFTLFVASIVIIVDLITLVYNFLQGELSLRFFLKVASVLVIAGSVFYYYSHELKQKFTKLIKVFSYAVVVLVLVAVVAGLFIAGLPQNRRLVRQDEMRVSDLQQIQWQVINYWQSKEKIPATLGELKSDVTGFYPPVDKVTNQPYEYAVLGDKKFQLCAVFDTDNMNDFPGADAYSEKGGVSSAGYYDQPVQWRHVSGKVCFDRTIDPDFYPPIRKTITQ